MICPIPRIFPFASFPFFLRPWIGQLKILTLCALGPMSWWVGEDGYSTELLGDTLTGGDSADIHFDQGFINLLILPIIRSPLYGLRSYRFGIGRGINVLHVLFLDRIWTDVLELLSIINLYPLFSVLYFTVDVRVCHLI
jgi:hypothetical protein